MKDTQISVMCCHPGYTYENETCVSAKSSHILRTAENNIHVFIDVR